MLASGAPASILVELVITNGAMLLKDCPPAVAAAALHWNKPNLLVDVSNQYCPLSGSPAGASDLATSCPRSISARTT